MPPSPVPSGEKAASGAPPQPRGFNDMTPEARRRLTEEALRNVKLRDRLVAALEDAFQGYAARKQELSLRIQSEAELLRANRLYQRMIRGLLKDVSAEPRRRERLDEAERERRGGLREQYEAVVDRQQEVIESMKKTIARKQESVGRMRAMAAELGRRIEGARKRESDDRLRRRLRPGAADGESVQWDEKLHIVGAVPEVTTAEDWIAVLRSRLVAPVDLPHDPRGRAGKNMTVLADVLRSTGRADLDGQADAVEPPGVPMPALPTDPMARLRFHRQRRQIAEVALKSKQQQQQGLEIIVHEDADEAQAAAVGKDADEVGTSAEAMVAPVARLSELVQAVKELDEMTLAKQREAERLKAGPPKKKQKEKEKLREKEKEKHRPPDTDSDRSASETSSASGSAAASPPAAAAAGGEEQEAEPPSPGAAASPARPRFRLLTERERGNMKALQECHALLARLEDVHTLLGAAVDITGDSNRPEDRRIAPASPRSKNRDARPALPQERGGRQETPATGTSSSESRLPTRGSE
eukprot:TRINITY_DN11413_c0_g1_i1.p1 TRINITY_DN11413_c0_g1~~TRINITY_DN11413_c0_g1_i1.p1  ORF type:complete len:553 (+),score=225.96 TRINITY_DN11413_c0_g1_i1:81-1661(+)